MNQSRSFENTSNKHANDTLHSLWLIYSRLKDIEDNEQLELLQRAREELGLVLNTMYRQSI